MDGLIGSTCAFNLSERRRLNMVPLLVFWWKACSYSTWVECKSPFWAAVGWDFSSCSPAARCAAAGASEQTSRGWLVPAARCVPHVASVEITCGLLPATGGGGVEISSMGNVPVSGWLVFTCGAGLVDWLAVLGYKILIQCRLLLPSVTESFQCQIPY